jgi:hypothetical protein
MISSTQSRALANSAADRQTSNRPVDFRFARIGADHAVLCKQEKISYAAQASIAAM